MIACLNPYYNGRYSWSVVLGTFAKGMLSRLNPYYNGRYSWRNSTKNVMQITISLNPYYNGRYSWSLKNLNINNKKRVLILIIMEDTHGETKDL